MRRVRIRQAKGHTSSGTKEPLAEGLANTNVHVSMRRKYRNWNTMSDPEIVAYARAYVAEKGITKPNELRRGRNKDPGLHDKLQRRKLVDQVFSSIRADQEVKQLATLADALESFGGSEK